MFKQWFCRCEARLRIELEGPLLVKSGIASLDGPDAGPVLTLHGGGDAMPFIPGSSLKGVVRSHLERIARGLRPNSVCIPYLKDSTKKLPDGSQDCVGCGFRLQGLDLKPGEAYRSSCAACRLFGSTRHRGRMGFGDAYWRTGTLKPAMEVRDHVAIDRFTGGGAGGLKFDVEVVARGTFETRVVLENFELWQLSALVIALVDFEDGLLSIGSGTSRGLGQVRGVIEDLWIDLVKANKELVGVAQLAPEQKKQYGWSGWAANPSIQLPDNPERRGLRYRYRLDAEWREEAFGQLVPGFRNFLAERNWLDDIQTLVRERTRS